MATYEFRLPDIGEGVVEGEIVRWLVKEGDAIGEDQPLLEVMTDKATVTIPSPRGGKVVRTHGREGEVAKVHGLLVTMEVADGDAPKNGSPVASSARPAPATEGAPVAAVAKPSDAKVLATPVTRRMAHEHGLDLADIAGSGPQGRVTKADVEAALKAPQSTGGTKAGAAGPMNGASGMHAKASHPAPLATTPADERVPLRGLRKRIAEKMVRSKFTAPHFTFVEEVDVTELSALRQRLNQELKAAEDSLRLSFLPFFCKALVPALRAFPYLNANFDEASQELVVRGQCDFGIAVATEDGLTVPVIKGAERMSLRQLAQEIARLGLAARERRLALDELSGGSFTITSLGQHGGLMATPIINHPEVAILGLHRIRPRPAVRDGQIVAREMMNISLSFDHRVIDGAVGADFTYALIRYLEHPELLLLELV